MTNDEIIDDTLTSEVPAEKTDATVEDIKEPEQIIQPEELQADEDGWDNAKEEPIQSTTTEQPIWNPGGVETHYTPKMPDKAVPQQIKMGRRWLPDEAIPHDKALYKRAL